MKKYTIALIMILSFLISSKLIYEEKFYRHLGIHDIQIDEQQYKNIRNKAVTSIEKEYDYMMGGSISISLGLLLIGYNHIKNKSSNSINLF